MVSFGEGEGEGKGGGQGEGGGEGEGQVEGITLSGLLGMFTLKKCACSSLEWCLLVRGEG